jgi:hypothetical protein
MEKEKEDIFDLCNSKNRRDLIALLKSDDNDSVYLGLSILYNLSNSTEESKLHTRLLMKILGVNWLKKIKDENIISTTPIDTLDFHNFLYEDTNWDKLMGLVKKLDKKREFELAGEFFIEYVMNHFLIPEWLIENYTIILKYKHGQE